MSRVKNLIAWGLLFTLWFFVPATAFSENETSVVIAGRVSIKFDNYRGNNQTLNDNLRVVIKSRAGEREIAADRSGYFVLENQPDETYRISRVLRGKMKVPNTMRYNFKSAGSKIVNMGHTILIINSAGRVNGELHRERDIDRSHIGNDNKYTVKTEKNVADYPILKYLAGNYSGDIRRLAELRIEKLETRKQIEQLEKEVKTASSDTIKIDLYRRILKLDPKRTSAAYRLQEHYNKQGKVNQALEVLFEARSNNPGEPWLIHKIAQQYEKLKDPGNAESHHQKYLEIKQDSGSYRYLANFYQDAGKTKKADALWDDGISKNVKDIRLTAAGYYLSNDDNRRALKLLETFVASNPGHWRANKMLLMLYRDMGMKAEGLQLIPSFEENSTDNDRYFNIGDFYKAFGMLDSALDYYRKFNAAKPESIRGIKLLADLLNYMGRFEEGLSLWEAALSNEKLNSKRSHHHAGIYYYNAGMYARAIRMFKKQKAFEDFKWNTVMLVRALIQNGQKNAAEEILGEKPTAFQYYFSHWAASESKDYGYAIALLKKALTLYDDNSLKKEKIVIERRIKRLEGNQKLDTFWFAYLQQIEQAGKSENWASPPAKAFEQAYRQFVTSPAIRRSSPAVRNFAQSIQTTPQPRTARQRIKPKQFQTANKKFAQQIVKKYKSVPGGITLEGDGAGLSSYRHVTYDAKSHALILNSKFTYPIPITREEARAILKSIAKDDRLGVSLGSAQIVYGAISKDNPATIKLQLADHFLGGIAFNDQDRLKGYKLADGYKPLKNYGKLGSGGVAVYFIFGNYVFAKKGTQVSLYDSNLTITLIPLSKEKNAEGGHLPDNEALEKGKISYFYKQNIEHILKNLDYYMKEPILEATSNIGQFAALARSLKKNGVNLAKLAGEM